ncbi:hypothetical protein BGZ54_000202 [Gamsiella multidivaricata]|nr:hypothetical protein BGZ54_000202 [Gamsiella multidivaricata]
MASNTRDSALPPPSNQHQQSSFANLTQDPSSPRWKTGFSIPWGRRGPYTKSGATEKEILEVMKEANRDRSSVTDIKEEYGVPGDSVDYEPVDLHNPPMAPFWRGSVLSSMGHQQQDSASSMQQFYYSPHRSSFREGYDRPPLHYTTEMYSDQQLRSPEDQGRLSDERPFLTTGILTHSADHKYNINSGSGSDRIPLHRSRSTDLEDGHSAGERHQQDELRGQSHDQGYDFNGIPIVHRAIVKLQTKRNWQHNYSSSLALNSTFCSVSSTISSTPSMATSHSRSTTTTMVSYPADTQSASPSSSEAPIPLIPTIPLTSSPLTLCSNHNQNVMQVSRTASKMSTEMKLQARESASMPATITSSQQQYRSFRDSSPLRDPSSGDDEISINMASNSSSPHGGSTVASSNAYSSSERSFSQSSTTLGAPTTQEREAADEEEGGRLCLSCSVPDWETFKAGLLPTSKQARETLVATIVLALVTITLEAILLQRHRSMAFSLTHPKGAIEISFFRPLMVYYLIFILAEVFAVGLLWDAAIHKNSLQLVAFTLFEWCMVSYSGLQVWQHDQLMRDIGTPNEELVMLGDSTTRMILFSQLGAQVVACLGITLLTWRLYFEFGWLVFQKLGADVSLRKMMKEYRLLFTLLKLDAFFFFGYAIQVAALTDKHWSKGLIEVSFAIPLSAIIILLGFYAMRHENKVTMGGFIACLTLLIGYMIYRQIELYQTLTGNPETDPYFFSRKTLTVFAALTLFMTALALIYAIVMLCNFNKGLKEAST